MHDLYALKTMLCDKLKDYGARGELNATSLNNVDTLAHACKNVCKIIDWCESRSDDHEMSFGRGRGPGAKRDAMGRYSKDHEMHHDLERLMDKATDDHTREEIRKLMDRI